MNDTREKELREIFEMSGCKTMVGLGRNGEEEEILFSRLNCRGHSGVFPIVTKNYKWDVRSQEKNAKRHFDRIEYVYSREDDFKNPMFPIWRKDDEKRIKTVMNRPMGSCVLEAGCSSGTLAFEICRLDSVQYVLGFDIREGAIKKAKKLGQKLVRAGHLTENQFCKILFDVGTTETVSYERESFDVVCAFELLEHIVPWEFDSVINSLIRFMKINGKMMITVPNRYPHRRYIEAGRSRWKAPDHKNFFSQLSLEFFLKKHFKEVKFLTVSGKSPSCGVHLFAECRKLVSPRE